MKKHLKKPISLLLSVCMLFSLFAGPFAAAADGPEEAAVRLGFDFDASDYSVSEDGKLTVTVKRNDAGTGAADITFRIADVLSEYGTDYVIADPDGTILPKTDGVKPSVSAVSDDDGSVFGTDPASEIAPPAVRAKKSSGSSLMDAVDEYLGTAAAYDDSAVGVDASDIVSELQNFFGTAQGAVGILHFAENETEKSFTVLPVDNDDADGTRLFMIALTSVESSDLNAALAPNPTAYVNLIDDEPTAAAYTLADSGITLTSSEPEAQLRILRTAGTNTFSSVFVSTVSDTAPEGSYDALRLREVAFLPGETEKTVTVRAKDFSVGGTFGIRIESDDGASFDCAYESIRIAADDSLFAAKTVSAPLPLAAADSTVLGDRFSSVDGTVTHTPAIGTASAGISGDEWVLFDDGNGVSVFYDLHDTSGQTAVPEYFTVLYANEKAGLSSKSPVNLAGVYNIRVGMGAYARVSEMRGVRRFGLDVTSSQLTRRNLHYTYFRSTVEYSPITGQNFNTKRVFTVTDQITSGLSPAPTDFGRSFSQTISTYEYDRVNVASCNDKKYLTFWLDEAACGVEFYGVSMEHTKYSLLPMPSAEAFSKSLYDLGAEASVGTTYRQKTFYDGETVLDYYPAAVSITYDGAPVTAFYSNANRNVVIAPSEPEKIEADGLVLRGVYFAKADVSAADVPTGADAGGPAANMLFVPAENGEIILPLNGDFVKSLIDAGVAEAHNLTAEELQIFPVYGHEKVTVILKNAVGSEFYNLADYWAASGSLTAPDGDKLYRIGNWNGTGEDVYAMEVDRTSVIRLWCHTAVDASAHGVCCASASNPADLSVGYHAKGSFLASAVTPSGIPVYTDDFTRADISADEDCILYPCVGRQTVSLRYFDQYVDGVRVEDRYRPDDLTGLAGYFDDSIVYDETTGEVRDAVTGELIPDYTGISGADGIVTVEVLTGGSYSFYVVPPENTCVYWTNMTADLNNDGIIDGEKEENAQNSIQNTTNPEYLIGSRLTVAADQDNIQYYYRFVPLGSSVEEEKTGRIVKNSSTFYELANGQRSFLSEPCAGSTVSIANWSGITNGSGVFTVQTGDLARSGDLSASVIVDDITYNFRFGSQYNNKTIELPALYRFSAKSLRAYYGKAENEADCSGAIIAKDDTLTIKAEVGSCGTIRPADARFEIRSGGFPKYTFTEDEVGFVPGIRSGTAVLTFNPKECIDTGDRIFVSFRDEAGNWYPYIDLGITFLSELKMSRIALPIFGAAIAGDEASDSTFEILGSTLCDLAMDALGDLTASEPRITYPFQVSADDHSVSWYETDYSYSFDTSLLPKFGKSSEEKNKNDEKENKQDLKEEAEKLSGDDARVDNNSSGKFKTSSSYIWQLSLGVGLRLTVSQRYDSEQNLKTYFEDMSFYLKAGTTADINASIALPIGISVLFRFQLDAKIVGIYRMYNNYKTDSTHVNGTLLYEDFSVFESNEKVSREGYVFLDPKITVTLGVKLGIISVNGSAAFTFDMDFCFGANDDTYGRLDVDLSWAIKILGFQVYSKSLMSKSVRLFGDDEFDLDVGQNSGDKLNAVMASALDRSLADGEFALDVPTDRSYLEHASPWLGNRGLLTAAGGTLGSAVRGTAERVLMTGSASDPYMKLADLGDGKLLMVFIGDDAARTSVNKRAIFYSLSSDGGSTWAEPVLLDDDGTLDDYPDVFDLGNGEVLVTWSSVDTVMPDGTTVVEALGQLNLKTAFFRTDSMTFGEITQLTRTTALDFCADVLPHAAYDADTDRIILYFTKTEYGPISKAEDFGTAESVTAYLFCEREDGEWVWKNTADAYSAEEITKKGLSDDYREQWYGQRFLDPRIDSGSAMPLIVSSDAVSYHGLALYTWVVDWDNDQNTQDDRDVFLQIYNFSENSFSYPYRVTRETGTYALPALIRIDDAAGESATYLFYGALEYSTDTTGERANSGQGEIRCINVSDAVSAGKYSKYENGSTAYYHFCYEAESGEPGVTETVWVPTESVTDCGNIEDYTVISDGDGQICVLWTDSEGSERQIYASMLSDDSSDWSLPYALTAGEDFLYGDISAAILNGSIYVCSGRTDSSDSSDTALVVLTHEPSSNVVLRSAAVSNAHPAPGEIVTVTAALVNDGLLPVSGAYELSLSVNGAAPVTEQTECSFLGGTAVEIPMNIAVPENFDSLTFTVTLAEQSISLEYARSAVLTCSGDAVTESSAPDGSAAAAYLLRIANIGNDDGAVQIRAAVGERTVGETELPALGMRRTETVLLPLDLRDSDYTVAESGAAKAEITVEVICGGETVYTGSAEAYKQFDAAAMRDVQTLSLPTDLFVYADLGGEVTFPQLGLPDTLRVQWDSSSDETAVTVSPNGVASAKAAGTSTLSGRIVPSGEYIIIGADGSASPLDASSLLPEELQKTVSGLVTVLSETEPEPEPETEPEAEPASGEEAGLRFTDVPETEYYYPAVLWAAQTGVTEGTSETTFRPDAPCTRAQIVTFLWRAAGCPEPSAETAAFADVEKGSYYEKAVLWAAEKGITKGTGPDTFSPDRICTRAQIVTFLSRYAGIRDAVTETVFTDVDPHAYYAAAVSWAHGSHITTGTNETTFRPDNPCTRAQAVTFLYRYSRTLQSGD